jgi:hypothetical protein
MGLGYYAWPSFLLSASCGRSHYHKKWDRVYPSIQSFFQLSVIRLSIHLFDYPSILHPSIHPSIHYFVIQPASH